MYIHLKTTALVTTQSLARNTLMKKLLVGGVNNMESIKRKLFDKLKEFNPDRDFVLGVISNVDTDEHYQHIIDFIDKGEDVTVENIIALSILLDKEEI